MKPIKLILEGSNLSGKSSVVRALEDLLLESTIITIHGYYHQQINKFFNTPEEMADYGLKKLFSLLPFLENSRSEGVILNRFHLTDAVYLKMLFNLSQDYRQLEQKLNELRVYLVLLDCNDQALSERLEKRGRLGKAGPWDSQYQRLCQKKKAFQKAFAETLVKNKMLLDNSNLTAGQSAREVIRWLQKGGERKWNLKKE